MDVWSFTSLVGRGVLNNFHTHTHTQTHLDIDIYSVVDLYIHVYEIYFVLFGNTSDFVTALRMMLIWVVHVAGRCDATMKEFFKRLRWSLESLQSGRFPTKIWDKVTAYAHPKVVFYT